MIAERKDVGWSSMNRMKEQIVMFVAWHLPKELVYWCAIRLMAHASASDKALLAGEDIVPELTCITALGCWNE